MKNKFLILSLMLFILCVFVSCSTQNVAVPTIKSIDFVDKDGVPLHSTDGWIALKAESTITVSYEGIATKVEFYTVPTGTEVQLEQRMIGSVDVDKNDRTASLNWKVPNGFIGNIWVLVYNNDIARSSNIDSFFIKAVLEQ